MNFMEISAINEKIKEMVDDAIKNGWQIVHSLPNDRWFRWREGHTPPACNVLGAILMFGCKDAKGNFLIPNQENWFSIAAENLGIDFESFIDFEFAYVGACNESNYARSMDPAAPPLTKLGYDWKLTDMEKK